MKTLNKALVTCTLITAFSAWCFGAPPSGPASIHVEDSMNTLWDLSKVPSIQLQDPWVGDDEAEVEAEYQINASQNGSGKLAGAGSTTVYVHVWNEDGHTIVPPFTGTYKFSGSISSSKGKVKVGWSSSVSGMAQIEGSRKLTMSSSDSATVDPVTMRATGRYSAKATASGLGSVSSSESYSNDLIPQDAQDELGEGSWTLTLNLTPDSAGKKLTGTAVVVNNQGTEWKFTVKGSYTAKSDTSKLTLSPDAAAKGSSVSVVMVGNNILSVKGKVAGQALSFVD